MTQRPDNKYYKNRIASTNEATVRLYQILKEEFPETGELFGDKLTKKTFSNTGFEFDKSLLRNSDEDHLLVVAE
ncbi:MAG: hypothetical protein JKY50_19135 [Oleispira sp.]|nr:hypothetical protein [Oleispira sp.]